MGFWSSGCNFGFVKTGLKVKTGFKALIVVIIVDIIAVNIVDILVVIIVVIIVVILVQRSSSSEESPKDKCDPSPYHVSAEVLTTLRVRNTR